MKTANEIIVEWETQIEHKRGAAHNIPDTQIVIAAYRRMRNVLEQLIGQEQIAGDVLRELELK